MTSCAEMYDSEMQQRIYVGADHFTYYAREVCAS